jgi:Domain of unknown function (DUF397)
VITVNGMKFRKSTYSGGDNGSNCVAVAVKSTLVSVLDTKKPDAGMFSVPRKSFVDFLKNL